MTGVGSFILYLSCGINSFSDGLRMPVVQTPINPLRNPIDRSGRRQSRWSARTAPSLSYRYALIICQLCSLDLFKCLHGCRVDLKSILIEAAHMSPRLPRCVNCTMTIQSSLCEFIC